MTGSLSGDLSDTGTLSHQSSRHHSSLRDSLVRGPERHHCMRQTLLWGGAPGCSAGLRDLGRTEAVRPNATLLAERECQCGYAGRPDTQRPDTQDLGLGGCL
eukprot:1495797-Prymnesium_polylepis.1